MKIDRCGLVSVTFRQFEPDEVIEWILKAGLQAVEWGGDRHVPVGDLQLAREVGRLSRRAGLEVATYGSYHNLGKQEEAGHEWPQVVATAHALGASKIRIWAGTKGSGDTTAEEFDAMVRRARHEAEQAQAAGILVVAEFHCRTLTDGGEAAERLLRAVDHPNFRSLWQPINGADPTTNLESLQRIGPWLEDLHVFHWLGAGSDIEMRPLAEGQSLWQLYLKEAERWTDKGYCLLEFVRDARPQQFLEDARTLKSWLEP